ncbi:MAG: hypothetical protein PVG46_00010 [Desulfobacterales bacterium]|jgi:hypothetical protein
MRIISRLGKLEKQALIKGEGPDAIAVKFNGGEISWNKKIYGDEEAFHNDVNLFFQDAPPAPGPRVILIKLWRDIKDISPVKSGTQPCS